LGTNILEDCAVSIFRVEVNPENHELSRRGMIKKEGIEKKQNTEQREILHLIVLTSMLLQMKIF
jgi:hypothetical protein